MSPVEASKNQPTPFIRLTWRVLKFWRTPPPSDRSPVYPDTFWIGLCSPLIRLRRFWRSDDDSFEYTPTQRMYAFGFRYARVLEIAK